MDISEALEWVAKNCKDEATLQRLKSRRVAKTLAEEVQRLRGVLIGISQTACDADEVAPKELLHEIAEMCVRELPTMPNDSLSRQGG